MNTQYFEIKDTPKRKTSDIIKQMGDKFDVYVWCEENIDKEFPAPNEETTRYFKKNIEADEELKSKSANDLDKKGIEGITLRERLIMELQYFEETRNHLDVENITLCAGSRHSDGNVPCVYWYAGYRRVYVDWGSPSSSDSRLRARAVVSKPGDLNLVPLDTFAIQGHLSNIESEIELIKKLLK